MWLLPILPPTRCEDDLLHVLRPTSCKNYRNWKPTLEEFEAVEAADRASCEYLGKFQDPRTGEWKEGKGCKQVPVEGGWGLESGIYMNWMRVSGLPKFRKLYAKIDQELAAGQELRLAVKSQFPTSPAPLKKAVVLATAGLTGGSMAGSGLVMAAAGVICVVIGFGFFASLLQNPHHIAKIKYLDWQGSKAAKISVEK